MESARGIIEAVYKKDGVNKQGKPYTKFDYVLSGERYSGFKDLEIEEGDEVTITYELNGTFKNYKSMVMHTPGGIEVTQETVGDIPTVADVPVAVKPTKIETNITVGQACNLAQSHIQSMIDATFTEEEYDEEFRKQTKRFFKLLREMKQWAQRIES